MTSERRKTRSFDRLKAVASDIKEQETVKRSLTVARKRQEYMLPQDPEVPGYEFAMLYSPAEHVSGDFCDIINIDEGKYGILVGDISGHGMEAGVVMGAARKALQIYGRSASSPDIALSWANDDLYRDLDRQTFMTVSYGVLDTARGVIQYVRAGHNHPLLIGPGGQWQEVKANGASIGVTTGEQFSRLLQVVNVPLQPGQSFLQFTDGVVEAHNRREEEYGIERFIKYIFRQQAAGLSLTDLISQLPQELANWSGVSEQEDDITVLAVKRTV